MGDTEAIMTLLKATRDDVGHVKATVEKINREMGTVQGSLERLSKDNEKQDVEIGAIRSTQMSCVARMGHTDLVRKLSEIESERIRTRDRDDITGRVDMLTQQMKKTTKDSNGAINVSMYRNVFFKMLPWFIVAVLTGAAAAGFLLARSVNADVDVKPINSLAGQK